jgi:hypothetical protein
MHSKTKLYIGGTVVVGFVLLFGSLTWFSQFPDMARYLACLSLACIASTLKVRLPGLQSTISVNFVFILIAIAQLSLAETLTLAFAATLVQCLWRPKSGPKFIQVLFNTSSLLISTALAYATAHAVPDEQRALTTLAAAATVFFMVNTGLISLVLALTSNRELREVWRQCHLWAFPYYLVGAAIAGAVSASSTMESWRISLLALPMMYLVYFYYGIFISSQTMSPARVTGTLDGDARK